MGLLHYNEFSNCSQTKTYVCLKRRDYHNLVEIFTEACASDAVWESTDFHVKLSSEIGESIAQ